MRAPTSRTGRCGRPVPASQSGPMLDPVPAADNQGGTLNFSPDPEPRVRIEPRRGAVVLGRAG